MAEIKAGFTTMLIKIRVTTESKKESVKKSAEDRYVISVKEPAENNRTNNRILAIMRKVYPGRPMKMIKGHHSPSKIVEIAGS